MREGQVAKSLCKEVIIMLGLGIHAFKEEKGYKDMK